MVDIIFAIILWRKGRDTCVAEFLTCVFFLIPGQLMDRGADVLPQDPDDVCQNRCALLIQIGEKLILIFLWKWRSGFDVGQVYVILLEERIGSVTGTVIGMNTDQTHKTRTKRTARWMQSDEEWDFFFLNKSRSPQSCESCLLFLPQNQVINGKRWGKQCKCHRI